MIDWEQVSVAERFLAAMSLAHECTGCHSCCVGMTGIAFSGGVDVNRMAKSLGISRTEFLREYTTASDRKPTDRWIKQIGEDNRCPFLSAAGCTQYEGRSSTCRAFPWIAAEQVQKVKETGSFILYKNCPGMIKSYMGAIIKSADVSHNVAQQIVAGPFGKICYLHMRKEHGMAISDELKALGIKTLPEPEAFRSMARTYAIGFCALFTPERREEDLKAMTKLLEELESPSL